MNHVRSSDLLFIAYIQVYFDSLFFLKTEFILYKIIIANYNFYDYDTDQEF